MGFWYLVVSISASWLCAICEGRILTEEFSHNDLERNATLKNNTAVIITQNYSDLSTPDGAASEIAEETATNFAVKTTIQEGKDDTTKFIGSRRPAPSIVPLAAGGIALMSGLILLSIVVGLFMYCNRNPGYVYEPALSAETTNHI